MADVVLDGDRADSAGVRVAELQPLGSPVGPFLAGTLVGGVAGAVAGTLLSERTRSLLLGLIHLTGRDLSRSEREQLRFELLEQ